MAIYLVYLNLIIFKLRTYFAARTEPPVVVNFEAKPLMILMDREPLKTEVILALGRWLKAVRATDFHHDPSAFGFSVVAHRQHPLPALVSRYYRSWQGDA